MGKIVKAGAGAILGLSLAGCLSTNPFDPPVDQSSPAAAQVETLARADADYPRWRDFPAAPQNVPTPAEIRTQVTLLETRQDAFATEVAALRWTLTENPEAWARQVASNINARLATPPPADATAQAEAFAARLRERAVPPPPIQ